MFKNFTMMMTFCYVLTSTIEANLQVAIPLEDFRSGNSIVFIARDLNGQEQVAGYVSLQSGKTQFSSDEIICENQNLSIIAEKKSTVVADVEQEFEQKDANLVYLYFEVDPTLDVVRILVIKDTILAENPFDIVEFSTYSHDDEDEEDFFDCQDDELSNLNLENIHVDAPVQLSHYDKMVLAACAFWAVQSSNMKHAYKKLSQWFVGEDEV